MEQAIAKKSTYFYEIDLLRFLAALMVVLCHYTYVYDNIIHVLPSAYVWGRMIRYGYMTVDIFFIVSGYVILMSSYNKSLRSFLVGRIVRLYPQYWVSCIVFFISMYFGSSFLGMPRPTFSLLLYNMSMLHEFFGKTAVNGAFWTLTVELSFYFIICLIIGFRLWKHLLGVIAVWLAITILLGPGAKNNLFTYLFIPRFSPCFISGMLFLLIQKKAATMWKLYGLLGITLLCSLRSANTTRHIMEGVFHDHFNPYIILGIAASFYIIMFIIISGKVRLSRFPQLALLGALTYPLYLMHNLGAGIFWYFGNKVNKYLLLVIVMVLMLLLAWLIYVQVEKRFSDRFRVKVRQLVDWLAKDRRVVPAENIMVADKSVVQGNL